MMGHQWNMANQGWPGNNFNGSNMSLNIPSQAFMSNDPQMYNPWMQPQPQYPIPVMHNGKSWKNLLSKRQSPKTKFFQRNSTPIEESLKSCISCAKCSITTFHNELKKQIEICSKRFD